MGKSATDSATLSQICVLTRTILPWYASSLHGNLSEHWAIMQLFCLYIAVLSSILLKEAAASANVSTILSDPLNSTDLNTGLLNATLGGIPRPPVNFDVEYEIGGAKLKVTACLMNSIGALKELALGDWQASIVDGTEYRLESYPEVEIVVNAPRQKGKIQARFVIWAITLGVYEMIASKKFEFAQFQMTWNKEVVGWVHVVDNPPARGLPTIGGSESNGTLDVEKRVIRPRAVNTTTGSDLVNISNVIDTSDLADAEDARLTVTFSGFGKTLSIFDVFIPIMIGLSDLATYPNAYRSPGFVVALQDYKAGICIFSVISERTGAPLLEYKWLIRMLLRIPEYMLQEHRFGEVNIKMDVDGVRVGWGRMSNFPCEPPPRASSISSLATS